MSWRVAVTTVEDRAGDLVSELELRGLLPVPLPCVEVQPAEAAVLEEARRAALSADLVILTSARALDLLWPEGRLPTFRVAAVGAATARRVTARGAEVVAVGEGGATDLVELLDLGKERVAYPHAEDSDPELIRELERRAAALRATPVYRTVPRPPPTDPAVDAVTFGSPSAVEGWLMARSLEGLVVGAIGPTTATRLGQRGHAVHVVPERPGYRELAEALARRWKEAGS